MPSNNNDDMRSGSDPDFASKRHEAKDWAILKHVSLYHFTFRHAVEKLFYPGQPQQAGTALEALARQGYLSNSATLETEQKPGKNKKIKQPANSESFRVGKIKFYLLGSGSKKLASRGFVFPKERLQPPSTEQSFYKHLSALWFCVFSGERRYRLDLQELNGLLSPVLPDGCRMPHQPAYCLANVNDNPLVYRLYPTKKTKSQQIVNEVSKKLIEDAEVRGLRPVIEAQQYGYAIIVPSSNRIADVRRDLEQMRENDSLLQNAKVIVRFAPTSSTLNQELAKLESGRSTKAPADMSRPSITPLQDDPPIDPPPPGDVDDFGFGSIIA